MKFLVAFFALVAVAFALPGGHGGGGGGGGHGGGGGGGGGGDLATGITQGGPVVTGAFSSPGLGFFNNFAPAIHGPTETRGFGPHVGGGGGGGKGH